MHESSQHLLLFGGMGSIGQEISRKFTSDFGKVTVVTRKSLESQEISDEVDYVCWDPLLIPEPNNLFLGSKKFSAICWAQGLNHNDNIFSFQAAKHLEIYRVNVLYIMVSLNYLLKNNLLCPSAKVLVISSIWQEISRQNKLSYGVTKSALKGLVLSLANDLSKEGILVNAILPGALDTEMTHSNLSDIQLEGIKKSTGFDRLPSLLDVSNMACHLLSDNNSGVTGQFIKVDLGFSDVRIV